MPKRCEKTKENIRKNCSSCIFTIFQCARSLSRCVCAKAQKLHDKAKSCEIKPININCQKAKSCLFSPMAYLKKNCAGGCEDRFKPYFPCCFRKRNMSQVTPIPEAGVAANKDQEVKTRDIVLQMETCEL